MQEPILEKIELHVDDRGSVYCALDHMLAHGIKRTYVVQNYSKGMIRAWHGHKKALTGLHVIKGAAKLVACKIGDRTTSKTISVSERKPGIFWIPPGWYNGSMSLEDDTRILVYSTLSFEEVQLDDQRDELSDLDKQEFFTVVPR